MFCCGVFDYLKEGLLQQLQRFLRPYTGDHPPGSRADVSAGEKPGHVDAFFRELHPPLSGVKLGICERGSKRGSQNFAP